jgi:hypothetical protein
MELVNFVKIIIIGDRRTHRQNVNFLSKGNYEINLAISTKEATCPAMVTFSGWSAVCKIEMALHKMESNQGDLPSYSHSSLRLVFHSSHSDFIPERHAQTDSDRFQGLRWRQRL